jgi:acyl-CoA thioesterase
MDTAMDKYEELFTRDNFADHLFIELVEVREGYARVQMPFREEHKNFFGTAHGGAIFALADVAFGAAANTREVVTVATHVSIDFLKAPRDGSLLIGTCRENFLGKWVGHYTMEVREEGGEVVALCQGWVYRTRRPLFPEAEST